MKKGEDYTGVTVVFACHDGAGNFLFGKRTTVCRDEHGCWDIGGGGVDFGETIEQTLRKEIKEEYCTDVLSFQFLGYRDVFRETDGKKTHWLAMDFKVHVDRSKVGVGEPHKIEAVEWFTLDNLPQPPHSQFPKFLELYKEKLQRTA
jgi:8-oxo-dGTP diphosphatase